MDVRGTAVLHSAYSAGFAIYTWQERVEFVCSVCFGNVLMFLESPKHSPSVADLSSGR